MNKKSDTNFSNLIRFLFSREIDQLATFKIPTITASILSLGLVILISLNWFSVGFAQVIDAQRKPVREAERNSFNKLQNESSLDVRVANSSDDAEEEAAGNISLLSSDIELVFDLDIQTVGLRFNGITIPQGANITSAYIQFQTDETTSEATTLTIHGQADSNPPTFTSATNNITNRALTTANVGWSPSPWTTGGQAGPDQQTPDISPVIQEIVNLQEWLEGNSLVIIISGTGKRVAEAYDGNQAGAPLLHVEYNSGPPNDPPIANDDNATTSEDIPLFIDVAHNDSDPDGSLNPASTNTSCAGCSETTNGSLVNNSDGTYIYSPNLNYNGTDTFVYEICDNVGACDNATVSITIVPIADSPVTNDDTGVVTQGGTLNEVAPGVLNNDSDPDGDQLAVSSNPITPPSHGTLTLNPDGSYTYIHDSSATTSDSFVYQVCDTTSLCNTATVNVTINPPQPTIFEVQVDASSDDAEERANGSVSLTSGDLELVLDADIQTVGIRFNGVTIPPGANITSAYIQFQTDETNSEGTNLTIHGQADGNPLTFTNSSNNITDRTLTTANVGWSPPPWTSIGEAGPDQQTPNIAPIIQEIVNLTEWSEGNSLVIIISGSGKRVAEAYNGNQAGAPLLHVDYMISSEPQVTIVVPPDGGSFIQGDAINFTANASDNQDGDLTADISWESNIDGVIGTGGSFQNANLTLGTHTITASATDSGGLTGSDQISISVTTPGGNLPPVVSAGPDQSISLLNNAFLDGTITDDGLPNPPGVVTASWTMISGPGTVTFTDSSAVDTMASFSVDGTYILALTADDGELAPSDQITITVIPTSTIQVPQDQPTIQAGIDAAQYGDLVLVSPGIYYESLNISGKSITLASLFYTTQDSSYIGQTIIDGGGATVILVRGLTDPDSKIVGFTIQNGLDGISTDSKLHILNNRFTNTSDAIDYEGGGGICRNNVFEFNSDDAIDLDGPVDVIIEGNLIENNNDDGIEIRLHDYTGPTLNIIIRDNIISGNGEDGIQLIDYPDLSDRFFLIERNLFEANVMAGLGLMDGGNTIEDYRAASIPEPIHLFNNTFTGSDHGLTGGDNLIALNNLFLNSTAIGIKGVDGSSIAAYNMFWNNGIDIQDSNIDANSILYDDPLLDVNHQLQPGSPAIDSGTAFFEWQGETVLNLPSSAYFGTAPDLGMYESNFGPPNTPPAAIDNTYSTDEDVDLTVTAPGVLSNDTDDDGDTLTAIVDTQPSSGTLILNSDGSFTYSPDLNFNSADSFTYLANDGLANSNPGTVTITVNSVNDQPAAADDNYSTGEDQPLTIAAPGVLGNDNDVDGNTLTAVVVTQPSNGTLTLSSDGSFTYSPDLNFNGSDSFSYLANDGLVDSNPATVTITVNPVNDKPVAADDSYSTNEDVNLTVAAPGVLSNDSDIDADPLTSIIDTQPSNGTLSLSPDGSFTYSPDPNFNGSDSFTYLANDGTEDSNAATVTITVNPVNDKPLAGDDTGSVSQGGTLNVPTPGVLSNDSDPENNPLTVSTTPVSPPSFGSLTLNPDGSYTYLHDGSATTSDSFVYQVCDSEPLCDFATVNINIILTAPTIFEVQVAASSDDAEERANGSVGITSTDLELVLDADIQTVGIRFNGVTIPQGANIISAYVQFQADETHSDATSLTIHGQADGNPLTFTNSSNNITNRAHTTTNVEWSPPPWTTVGEAGPDQQSSDIAPVIQEIVNLQEWSAGNSLVIIISGSGKRVAEAYNGIQSGAPLLHVEYNTGPPNNPPVAADDNYSTDEDLDLIVVAPGVLSNDSDLDGDPLTVIVDTQPSDGTLSLNTNGSFTYSPNPNFNGSDSFIYFANDGTENSIPSTVTITVNPINDKPVAGDDMGSVSQGGTLNVPAPGVLSNDSDPENNPLTVSTTPVSPPSFGSLTINADGSYTYIHDDSATTSDSFVYQVCDSEPLCDIATVNITIIPPTQTIFEVQVAASSDDAEERESGNVSLTSGDLEMVLDADIQTVGIRFNGVTIPQGANITSAYVQFQTDETHPDVTSLTIHGQADGNPLTFTTSANDITNRALTTANVDWTPPLWTSIGEAGPDQQTPDIAPIIQEIVNSSEWSDGNSLVIIISGSGKRVAESYDGTQAGAPLLHVEYIPGPPNDPPVAVNDAYSTDEDVAVPVPAPGVLSNDSDIDGDTLSAVVDTQPSDGTLSLNPDGSFTYSPDLNFNGMDSFTYLAYDGNKYSNAATVTITVNPVQDKPTAADDTYWINEDLDVNVQAPGVLGNDSDAEGDPLTAVVNTQPSNGTLTLNPNGSFTYSPGLNFNGIDSFTYIANDGTEDSNPAMVTINVGSDPPVLIGAGDIASCDYEEDEETAKLIDNVPGTVFTTGDNAYRDGTEVEFNDCYEPTWGRHKYRTRPSSGNHDYHIPGASAYFNYFGAAAGDPDKGYYSYDLGDWHIIVLNSECSDVGGCEISSPQGQWLQADLASNPSACTLAYWHKPLFASESNRAGEPDMEDFWTLLYDANADVVLNGHNHNYERFAPQDPFGVSDPENGIREFVVGTGGAGLYDFVDAHPNSEVRDDTTHGVLKLTLHPTSYDWEFIPIAGQTFTDSGTASCVQSSNNPPIANDDSASTPEDSAVLIDVVANDTDPDGNLDPSSTSIFTPPNDGLITNNGNGNFTYTPNADFNGSDSFIYEICDSGNPILCNTATVTITVNPINDTPLAADDAYSSDEDVDLTVAAPGVLGNDSDVDGDTVTTVVNTQPSSGTLNLNPDGSFTYSPDLNFNGSDSFTYLANDGTANSNVATVTISINPINDAPLADANGPYNGTVGVVVQFDGSGSSDVDGTISSYDWDFGDGNLGTGLNPSHMYNAVGNFTIVLTVTDDGGASATDTTTANILAKPNSPPVAVGNTYSTDEDVDLTVSAPGVLGNDSDLDGDTLTASVDTQPSSGTLTLNPNGSFTYSPDPNFNGTDSFTYLANDGTEDSNPATVTITINSVNDQPAAADDNYSTGEDQPLTITAPGVLGNDNDIDGDTLTAVVDTQPNSGTLTLNSDGSFTYSPDPNFNGADSFSYLANDGLANSNPATVTVTVNSVNDQPVAADDAYSTNEDQPLTITAPGVLSNDNDVDGDTLTAVVDTQPSGGTLTLNSDGSFTYSPDPNFNGSDSFTYLANDGLANSNPATVTITVNPVNDNPLAVDDTGTVTQGGTLDETAPGVLSNDSDLDGDLLTVSTNPVSPPSHGTLTLNTDGSYIYAHDGSATTSDSFVYQVCDGAPLCDTAVVDITISPSTPAIFEVQVAASSDDAEESAIGSVALTSSDLELVLETNIQTVGIRFNGVTIPQGANITFAYVQFQADETHSDATSLTIHGQADGNPLTFTTSTNNITNRSLTTANVQWTPPPWTSVGEAGPDQVTSDIAPVIQEIVNLSDWSEGSSMVIIIDGTGKRVAESFDGDQAGAPLLHVEYNSGPPNNSPITVNDTYSTDEDTDLIVAAPGVLGNDSDLDGDTLSTIVDTQPSNGTLTLSSDGSFTYSPDLNFNGTDSFTYVANDGTEDSTPATVTITVNPVNDQPAAADDTANVIEGGTLSEAAPGVLSNDSDLDGDLLTVSTNPVSPPSHGTLTLNTDGSYIYAHDGSATTSDSFVYQVCDGAPLCDTAVVDITISPSTPAIFEVQVAASSDDAEESAIGSVALTSSDLELVFDIDDIRTVGMRFNGITIPQGANITSAYIQFKTDETDSEATALTIHGQAESNPPTFTTSTNDITNRALTTANVEWTPPPWTTVGKAGPDQQTPDISPVIQEIVNLSDWSEGSSMVIIIDGTGKRVAESFDGDQAGAPLLHVEFHP